MSKSTFVAIGGGSVADEIIEKLFSLISSRSDARVVVMTMATAEPDGLTSDYNAIFRKKNVKHVEMVDVSQREDAFKETSIKKVSAADLVYFTGGDQLNVTSLFGGSPLHRALDERVKKGIVVAGTSAGAAIQSSSMIISGRSDDTARIGSVTMAPGLDLISDTIIDTHFSQRGRHGRLLAAIAHHPQVLGLGIDESTAIVVTDGELEVIGKNSVTIIDGGGMTRNNLPYCKEGEPVMMCDVKVHILTAGGRYEIGERIHHANEC